MSKKLLLSVALAVSAIVPAVAQLNGDGYYRVSNYMTDRYVYIRDNRGSLNMSATTAELGAIELWKDHNLTINDPATVIYIQKMDNEYNLKAQGTSVYDIIGHYCRIRAGKGGAYYCYASSSGASKYLGDGERADTPQGIMSGETTGDYRLWYIQPITASGDNYFGFRPSVEAAGKHYFPFYGSFPFSASSAGLKFYYVSDIKRDVAIISEISGTVPAATPVLVECPSAEMTGNRINLGGSAPAIQGNRLGGVYFDNPSTRHYNRTAYKAATMRVLGTTADGKLGFVTASGLAFLPANQSYLNVPEGSPATLQIMTAEEYAAYEEAHTPQSVTLSATEASLDMGATLTLTATVLPADAFDTSLTWTTSNASVATVSAQGVVSAVAPGTAVITATAVNGISASCTVTVSNVEAQSVTITPAEANIYRGHTLALTANVYPANTTNPSVTWTTSAASVVTVDATGVITGVSVGTATVTATTVNGHSATCQVTVAEPMPTGISFAQSVVTVDEAFTLQLEAILDGPAGMPTDIVWTSSNEAVATVDAEGVVTGIAVGSATVTATTVNGLKAECTVNVVKPRPRSITVEPQTLALTVEATAQLTATVLPANAPDLSVVWTSADESVATVSSTGLVTAVGKGETVITATTVNGLTCDVPVGVGEAFPTSITLDCENLMLPKGRTHRFTATILPANAENKSITWLTSDTGIATVTADGTVYGRTTGTVTITARTINGLTAECEVEVYVPVIFIALDHSNITAEVGTSVQLTATITPEDATYKTLDWTSSDLNVATVDNDGLVTITGEGSAQITATAIDGTDIKAVCRISGTAGIDDILTDQAGNAAPADVYTIDGRLVMRNADAEAVGRLAPGLYIIRGEKVVVK